MCELLQSGAVMNKSYQPHEGHIPYLLQLFIDYNLYGMNLLNLGAVKFRRGRKTGKLMELSSFLVRCFLFLYSRCFGICSSLPIQTAIPIFFLYACLLNCFTVRTPEQIISKNNNNLAWHLPPSPASFLFGAVQLYPCAAEQVANLRCHTRHTAVFISAGQRGHSQVSFCSLYCYPWLSGEGCHASCHIELVLILPQPQDASGVFWKLPLFSSPILPPHFFSHALSCGLCSFLSLFVCLTSLHFFLYFILLCLFPLWLPHRSLVHFSPSALFMLLNEEAKVKSSGSTLPPENYSGSFYRTRRLKLHQKVRAGQNKNKQAGIGCRQQVLCSL